MRLGRPPAKHRRRSSFLSLCRPAYPFSPMVGIRRVESAEVTLRIALFPPTCGSPIRFSLIAKRGIRESHLLSAAHALLCENPDHAIRMITRCQYVARHVSAGNPNG